MNLNRIFSTRSIFSTQFIRRASEYASDSPSREKSLNMVLLIGRVGQDPKIGGKTNKKVIMFSMATNEYFYTDDSVELKSRVDWHRIAVFTPRLQEMVENSVRAGDRLHVTGRLHHNIIDTNVGDKRYVSSIIADNIIYLSEAKQANE